MPRAGGRGVPQDFFTSGASDRGVGRRKLARFFACIRLALAHDVPHMQRRRGWIPATAFVLLTMASCGGRLLPLPGQRDGGGIGTDSGSDDASTDGNSSLPDGPPTDERGPPPLPVCTGQAMCIPPEAGLQYVNAAVIKCQPEEYPGPWTLILERLAGTSFQFVQKQVVQEPGFGWTFDDSSGPPTQLTYRVCVLVNNTTAECGAPFTTQAPPNCACEATSCYLQTACNTTIDDQCQHTIQCGACTNGMPCNPQNNSCCAMGFMSDGWGGCVCAPPTPKACPIWFWDTVTCSCMPGF